MLIQHTEKCTFSHGMSEIFQKIKNEIIFLPHQYKSSVCNLALYRDHIIFGNRSMDHNRIPDSPSDHRVPDTVRSRVVRALNEAFI